MSPPQRPQPPAHRPVLPVPVLSSQSPGCHRSRCSPRSWGPGGRTEPASLRGRARQAERGRGGRLGAGALPARGAHRGVGTGTLAARCPARSRTTPPRRCWSCLRGRRLLGAPLHGAGRALGRAGRAWPGALGEAGAHTGTSQPCCHPHSTHVALPRTVPIPIPIRIPLHPAAPAHRCMAVGCSRGLRVLPAGGGCRPGAAGRARHAGGARSHCSRAPWRRKRKRRRTGCLSCPTAGNTASSLALRGMGHMSPGGSGTRCSPPPWAGRRAVLWGRGTRGWHTFCRERLHPVLGGHQREQLLALLLLARLPAQRVCGRAGGGPG